MRLRKALSIAGLVLVALLVTGVTYLGTADLGRHREWIESFVSNRLGRTFSIEGEFHLRLGRTIHLSAGHIRLANASWGMRPDMLDLDRVDLQVDLWSLFSKPVRIRSLSLGAGRVSLERNEQFQANWVLRPHKPRPAFHGLPVILEQADAHNVVVTLHGPRVQQPVDVQLNSVQVTEDPNRLLDLSVNGRVDRHVGTIKGTLGPVPSLVTGRNLKLDLESEGELAKIKVNGSIASLKDLEQPDIRLAASGPAVETITSVFSLPTIAQGPFNMTGTVTGQSGNIDLRLEAALGDLNVDVQLDAHDLRHSPRFDLTAQARGPSLGGVVDLLGLKGLPQQPFTFGGNVRHDVGGTSFEKIRLEADSIHLLVDGRVGEAPEYHDTSLTVEAAGPDLSPFGRVLGLDKMRPASFRLTGHVDHAGGGLMLESGQLKIADNVLQANGRLGTLPDLEGADLKFSMAVPDLASLGLLAGVGKLPKLPVKGGARIAERSGTLALDSVDLDLSVAKVSCHGTITRKPKAEGSRLDFTVAGANLSRLGDKMGIQQLPSLPFEMKFRAGLRGNAVALQDVVATVGTARLDGNGVLTRRQNRVESRIELSARGPDLSLLLQNVENAPKPRVPFELQSELVTSRQRISVRKMGAKIGDASLSVQGALGSPPRFSGTDLNLQLSGRSLAKSLRPFGIEQVPDESFELGGHLAGSPKRIVLESVHARLGEHRGRGNAMLEPGDPARLRLRFDADALDLTPLLPVADTPGEKPRSGSGRGKLVISDRPLSVKWPQGLLADADIKVRNLRLKKWELFDLSLVGKLQPGQLEVQPVNAFLAGGQIHGALLLRRQGDGLQAQMKIQATDARLGAALDPGIPVAQLPPADIDVSLSGQGRSLHDLASTANGRIQFVYGSGRVANKSGAGLLTSDLVTEIFRTINPFTKREPFTQLQCGLAAIDAKDGVLTSDMVLMQTDKLLFVGSGRVNLTDETFDLEFASQPREGVGLSVAGIVQSYLKVAGTLAQPTLTLNPKGVVITGAAAAATGGLSLVLQGVLGRLISSTDVCGKELEKRGLRLPGSD